MKNSKKLDLRQKRKWRVRKKISGTKDCPRLSLNLSQKHIRAQLIDDVNGVTLFYVSTLDSNMKSKELKPNQDGAQKFGKIFGDAAKEKGFNAVVFDRGFRSYHGVVKTFANAARESLNF